MAPDIETSLTYCTYCPKLCRHTCPVSNAEARETLTPQTKMATMRLLRLAKVEPRAEASPPLYGCTGCGACTEACKHGVTPGRHLFDGRADAEREGHGHPSLGQLPERVRGHAESAARKVHDYVAADRFRAEAEVAFLPACDDPALAVPMLALADRVGAGYLTPADVTLGCGGYPLLAGGFPEAFRLHAEALAKQLHGYAKVVVACPACAWAMKREYPAHGVPLRPQVVHTTEFLGEFVERLPAGTSDGEALFYHDPCYLGRHLGIYDPPRKLLGKAVGAASLRELSRNRAEAECSGGGGVLPLTMPDTASAIASHRLAEVHEAGARKVATSCATCKRMLTREGVVARDVVEIVEEATRERHS
jgi:Fe-S oxidoreductase